MIATERMLRDTFRQIADGIETCLANPSPQRMAIMLLTIQELCRRLSQETGQ